MKVRIVWQKNSAMRTDGVLFDIPDVVECVKTERHDGRLNFYRDVGKGKPELFRSISLDEIADVHIL